MKKNLVVLIHILFWFIVISMTFSFLVFGSQPFSYERLISLSCKMALEIINFYVFYGIIIPLFYIKKHYLKFLIASIIYISAYIPLYAFTLSFTDYLLGITSEFGHIKAYLLIAIYYTILYILLGGLLKLAVEGYESNRQKILLEQQNVKSELALLRSQINPHFLFNTLNTIHAFVKSNPDKASHSIIKLSDIMRFILYDTTYDQIPLQKEIEYLHDYIDLQKYRLDNPGFVLFETEGSYENINIPPMLLIPFVENAFKHGKVKVPAPGIRIKLAISNNEKLEFIVENYISLTGNQKIEDYGGIGLSNITRRLELLFPDQYKLEIDKKNSKFIVKLDLILSSRDKN